MSVGPDLQESFEMIPIRSLAPSTRHLLSVFLDPPACTTTEEGLLPDASGLAELAGFDHVMIRFFQNKSSVTASLLDSWNHGTVGNLFEYLSRLERYDCLTEARDKIISDASKWKSRRKKEHSESSDIFTENDCEAAVFTENGCDVICPLTADDVVEGHIQKYAACVCCADDDLDLARSIEENLSKRNIRVFIPQIHLLGGLHELESTAEVIEERCEGRVIVLISGFYSDSPACRFATLFAKTLDPDSKRKQIIPVVMADNVDYPRVLRGITTIKYHRSKSPEAFYDQICLSLGLHGMIQASKYANREETPSRTVSHSLKPGLSVSSTSSNDVTNDLSNCREISRTESIQTLNISNETSGDINQSNQVNSIINSSLESSRDMAFASCDSAYQSCDFQSQLKSADKKTTISTLFKSFKKAFRTIDKNGISTNGHKNSSSNDVTDQVLKKPDVIERPKVASSAKRFNEECEPSHENTTSNDQIRDLNDVTKRTQDFKSLAKSSTSSGPSHKNTTSTNQIRDHNDVTKRTQDFKSLVKSSTSSGPTCEVDLSTSSRRLNKNHITKANVNRDEDKDEHIVFEINL